MKVGSWSTNPGSNNSTPPDGWPEGQAPSTINDCGRQMMAEIRTLISDLQFIDYNNTPSYLSANSFSMGTADVTNFQIGRRVKCYDATTLYGTIESVSASFVQVRLDSGALTSSLSSIALGVITPQNNSLPDHFKVNNAIINGDMEIWQRTAGASPANATRVYTADRWSYVQDASAAVNISRAERSATATNAPTLLQAGRLINSSYRVSVSAADAALGAAEHAVIEYAVEGYDWRNLAHRPSNMLEFWAYTNRTGVYCVALRNAGLSASFVQNYTISAANAWSRFAITVPEAPTNVTWDYSTGVGLRITFTLAGGSGVQGGAGNWTATSLLCSASQTNFVQSAGNVFMLTGVGLYPGNTVLPMNVRPYQQELAACQRYCYKGLPFLRAGFPAYVNGANMGWPQRFPVPLRAQPNALSGSIVLASQANIAGTPGPNHANAEGYTFYASASGSAAFAEFTMSATSYVLADAEPLV
jgi:hypothetical protein